MAQQDRQGVIGKIEGDEPGRHPCIQDERAPALDFEHHQKELGIDVDTLAGKTGEFSVWVDDRMVAQKAWLRFPSDRRVLQAVRAAMK